MKYILTLVLCLGFAFTSQTFGQEETKKVVIVKKKVDENGKVTKERIEASGEKADELIKKMKEEGSFEDIDIEIEVERSTQSKDKVKKMTKDVTVEKKIVNGKETTVYKIVTEKDGKKEVTIWQGDGEMPDQISEKLENVEIHTEHINEDGDVKIIIKKDHDEEMDEHESVVIEERIVHTKKNKNKVTLGVMIEDDSEGVVISEIIEESPAQNAGLKVGDTILKVDDNYVFNMKMLLNALSKFDKGDKMKVTYLRDGKEMNSDAQF